MKASLVPVVVDLVGECDHVALIEAQLSLIFRLKVIQSPAARLVCGCGETQEDGEKKLSREINY